MWPVASLPQSFSKTFFGKHQYSFQTGSRYSLPIFYTQCRRTYFFICEILFNFTRREQPKFLDRVPMAGKPGSSGIWKAPQCIRLFSWRKGFALIEGLFRVHSVLRTVPALPDRLPLKADPEAPGNFHPSFKYFWFAIRFFHAILFLIGRIWCIVASYRLSIY